MNRRALLLAPLGVAVAGGAAFWAMLRGMESGRFDPRGVPSPLIGKSVPEFTLPPQPPAATGFGSAELRAAGRPVLVNFFASWCLPCLVEQPQLMALQADGVPVWGIAYKDKEAAAAGLLAERGNPFVRLARDGQGRVAIDWGVYGVPETFLVDRAGIIRWRWAGPLTEQSLAEEVRPLLQRYA